MCRHCRTDPGEAVALVDAKSPGASRAFLTGGGPSQPSLPLPRLSRSNRGKHPGVSSPVGTSGRAVLGHHSPGRGGTGGAPPQKFARAGLGWGRLGSRDQTDFTDAPSSAAAPVCMGTSLRSVMSPGNPPCPCPSLVLVWFPWGHAHTAGSQSQSQCHLASHRRWDGVPCSRVCSVVSGWGDQSVSGVRY